MAMPSLSPQTAALSAALCAELDVDPARIDNLSPVSGGDTSPAYRLTAKHADWFVKVGKTDDQLRFVTERYALERLADSKALRVPAVTKTGSTAGFSYLAMEWLDLCSVRDKGAAALGRRLARLHRETDSKFGWVHTNFIGQSTQRNDRCDRWDRFFVEERLGVQAQWTRRRTTTQSLYEPLRRLMTVAMRQLECHTPLPSLLHGDLWAGNWGVVGNQEPVIFDPAAYFGDRETDLAMTRLFGGFPEAFYAAYDDVWPLPDDHHARVDLYQLYHIVNHANLFGGHYVQQAHRVIERCLR